MGKVDYFAGMKIDRCKDHFLDSISTRLLLFHVTYDYGLLSIWHSPIITLIFSGYTSIPSLQRITPWFPYKALHSPIIKMPIPHHLKVARVITEIQY
ncbi:hypothetical protein Acr_07g0012410 [Actinidia rufa]|uniref:Uncharacterized protein n=1 Tax=Actinidia rufa TaxID=165716 RepID=A0A7J0EX52_9ERIC|nr:hypothetical protein Acr_07g0012410 [Actinidia rufa]